MPSWKATGSHHTEQLTSTDNLNLNSLFGRLVEATLVRLGGLDGGGEEGVDEGGLAKSRFTCDG